MLHEKPLFKLILFVLLFLSVNKASAQCNLYVVNFPYNENFELNDGNWTVNGTLADWEWGSPSKPVINTAGTGLKCWVTGGLTNGFYNNGEASWLQSPCFNFSTLINPYISFKVFWETEKRFDGANMQYSTDAGSTWSNIGSASDPINCLNENWFNSPTVSFLSAFGSQRDGWSGSIQASCPSSGGSGDWVIAKHTLPFLAGKPSVIFRFTFAAGTQCNNFDGFAIDNITISEAPPNNGTIISECIDSNSVKFSFNTDICPTNFIWNFDDVIAGSNNNSTLSNPQHKFSAPGTYNVTLYVSGPDNATFNTSKQITIIGLKAELILPPGCNGEAIASAKVTVTGSPGPFDYKWNTNPEQNNATAINLAAGVYTVNVSEANACSNSTSIQILSNPLTLSDSILMPGCLYSKGKISISVQGGEPPYSYNWLPLVSTGNIADDLNPGNYQVIIKDNRNCSLQKNYTIITLEKPIIKVFKISDFDCGGSKFGAANATATGGKSPYSYWWNTNPNQLSALVQNLKPGTFSVLVKDSNGCEAKDSVKIKVNGICNDIYFPNSFSPNGDNINDKFGPLGNVIEITKYSMSIYNRFGELIFRTNDPFIKWDGLIKGKKAATGTYVWDSNFLYQGFNKRSQFGSITLIN